MTARCFPGRSLLFPDRELDGRPATAVFRGGDRPPLGGAALARTAQPAGGPTAVGYLLSPGGRAGPFAGRATPYRGGPKMP